MSHPMPIEPAVAPADARLRQGVARLWLCVLVANFEGRVMETPGRKQ